MSESISICAEFPDSENVGQTHFTIDLSDGIDFTDGYQVGIENLTMFANSWEQVRPDSNLILMKNSEFPWIQRVNVETGFYHDRTTFIGIINDALKLKAYSLTEFVPMIQDLWPERQSFLYFEKMENVHTRRNRYNFEWQEFEGKLEFGGKLYFNNEDHKMQFVSISTRGVTSIMF